MTPGARPGHAGRRQSAHYAKQRREALGMTQADVASAAGVRDVKTIRNLETGRNWPNDLTRRGIETALKIEIGTLDRLADGGGPASPGGSASPSGTPSPNPGPGGPTLPTAQELIDLSSAISKLSQAHEAMLMRGDDATADQVRGLIDAVSGVMAGFRPVLQEAGRQLERGRNQVEDLS